MTLDHIKRVAQYYDKYLESFVILELNSTEIDEKIGLNCDFHESENYGLRLSYVRWMCQQIMSKDDIDKANLWLGFIQGVLWAEEIFTIQEMRDHNRDIKNVPIPKYDEIVSIVEDKDGYRWCSSCGASRMSTAEFCHCQLGNQY